MSVWSLVFMQDFSVESKTSGKFIKHLVTRPSSPVQVKQWSKHESKKPRDQNQEDGKLQGPSQKTVESCGTRSFIQSEEKLTTRAQMQIRKDSRRLGNQHRAKEAAGWAEVVQGRPAQADRPSPFRGTVASPLT
jgi:hypothetical protein